jgi:hypothetical protein
MELTKEKFWLCIVFHSAIFRWNISSKLKAKNLAKPIFTIHIILIYNWGSKDDSMTLPYLYLAIALNYFLSKIWRVLFYSRSKFACKYNSRLMFFLTNFTMKQGSSNYAIAQKSLHWKSLCDAHEAHSVQHAAPSAPLPACHTWNAKMAKHFHTQVTFRGGHLVHYSWNPLAD